MHFALALVSIAALALSSSGVAAQDAKEPDPDPLAKAPSVSASQRAKAERRAVQLLLALQESLDEEGADAVRDEWPYEGVYREGGAIPIGYRVGGTSIAAEALLETEHAREQEPAREAVERALDFVLEGIARDDMSAGFRGRYDVRGWGHAYALSFLLTLRRLDAVPKARAKRVDTAVTELVAALQQTEIVERGGWNYSRGGGADRPASPSPFMTAPTLLALFEARRQGEEVDAGVVTRALDALERAHHAETGYVAYSGEGGAGELPGAIGRMPVGELTLLLAGRGSTDRVRTAVDAFFEHWEWLEVRRRQHGTHVAPYGIAPYYFFYAHRYAAEAIEALPEAERGKRRAKLDSLLWLVREESGGWNDRVFPRSENFGTAMSLRALLARRIDPPAGWKSEPTGEAPEK